MNVLNLVAGEAAVVESPNGEFEPLVVHYAETFIVPAAVGPYTIRPLAERLRHVEGVCEGGRNRYRRAQESVVTRDHATRISDSGVQVARDFAKAVELASMAHIASGW